MIRRGCLALGSAPAGMHLYKMSSLFKRLRAGPDLFDDEFDGDYKESDHINLSLERDKEYTNPFDSLPKELIQEICMLLSLRDKMSLRLVNRQLYTICSDPHLWRKVFIDDAYHMTNAPFIKLALKTCQPHVQSLSLRGQLPFSQYQSKILDCINLHTLNLYGIEITDNELEKISSPTQLPHLQHLTIKNDLTDQAAFSHLSNLKKLVTYSNYGSHIFDRWVLNSCFPQILIIVSQHPLIGRFPTPPITHSAHFAVYARYHRPLNFDFYDVPKYSLQLGPNNSESVAVTANGELHIAMKNIITPTAPPKDDDVCQLYAVFEDKDIAPGLPVYTSQSGVNITVLGFASVTVSLESFHLIVKGTPNVLEVSFKGSYVSDDLSAYLVPLSEYCLKLRGLNMSRLKPSSGGSLKADVELFWCLLSKMKCLEFLSLHPCCLLPPVIDSPSSSEQEGGSSDLPDVDLAVKDSMIQYAKSMSRLRGLHVIDCYFHHNCMCNKGLVHQHLLPIISNMTSLIYLKVEFPFSSHKSKGFEEVLRNCRQLSVLCIDNATLTLPADPALYSNLTHLSLGDSMRISPGFIAALAINSKLKHFVYNDDKIQRSDVRKLVESCNLITLKLPYIDESSLIKEKFLHPNVGEFENLHS